MTKTELEKLFHDRATQVVSQGLKLQTNESAELAGAMVNELRDPELPSAAAVMLGTVFREDSITSSTRWWAYNALAAPNTFSAACRQAEWAVSSYMLAGGKGDKLLRRSKEGGQGGIGLWTEEQTTALVAWSLRQPWTCQSLAPAVSWGLSEEGGLQGSAAWAMATAIPWGKQEMKEAMIWAVDESLKDESVRLSAKEAIVQMLRGESDR